jgi:hypothetical protein
MIIIKDDIQSINPKKKIPTYVVLKDFLSFVYYESRKREVKTKPVYDNGTGCDMGLLSDFSQDCLICE